MSAILNIICCAGNCCCTALNSLCKSTMKINPVLFPRIGYIIIQALSITLSVIILYSWPSLLSFFNRFILCPDDNKYVCLGISNSYRMSFTLTCFHLLIMIFSLFGQGCSKAINTGCWMLKFFFILGVYFAFLFISNKVFNVYAEISRYISILFVLYEVMVTISLAHVINIKLVENIEISESKGENGTGYKFLLILLSLIFLGIGLTFPIICFIYYSNNVWTIVNTCLSICFGIAFTGLSISNIVNRKRLLTSLYIFSYISYLNWSAILSKPTSGIISYSVLIGDMLIGLSYIGLSLYFLGFYVKKEEKIEKSILNDENKEEKEALNKSPMLETDKSK